MKKPLVFGAMGVALASALGVVAPISPPSTEAAPNGVRLSIDDLTYRGAFRLSSETFGASNTNYAVGTLAYHAANHSLFIAGHAQHNAIAEFAIPDQLGTGSVVDDLPAVETPRQEFSTPLDSAPTGNPDGINRINGMYVHGDQLIVNAERWYDASGDATDTTLVLGADDLDGPVAGYFKLDGAAHAGGYLSAIPADWQSELGGDLLTGSASNTSIISRHSVGPSLFAADSSDFVDRGAASNQRIVTQKHLNFPFSGAHYLGAEALDTMPGSASSLWNFLAKARYAFIAPGTSTFVVLGQIGGVESGIGYKIRQDNDNRCGGYCAYAADDGDNAYWLFDVNEILAADDVHAPRPYAHGSWSVPFDDGGQHPVIGGSFDPASGTLYIALGNAGQVGTYDRPPLIAVFDVPSQPVDRGAVSGEVRALAPAVRRSPR